MDAVKRRTNKSSRPRYVTCGLTSISLCCVVLLGSSSNVDALLRFNNIIYFVLFDQMRPSALRASCLSTALFILHLFVVFRFFRILFVFNILIEIVFVFDIMVLILLVFIFSLLSKMLLNFLMNENLLARSKASGRTKLVRNSAVQETNIIEALAF